MPELQPAKPVNLDTVLYVLRKTLLSPVFAGLAALFTFLFQKTSYPSNDLRNAFIYFVACWSLWFLSWSSRVWASRSWEHGLPGLLGINKINWDDQVVVVTGGRQGLGQAFVNIFRMKGVPVAVLDREMPSEVSQDEDLHFYQCDISDYKKVQEVAQKVAQEVGKPTILINNAGYVSGRQLLDLSEAEIRRTFEVNTMGPFWIQKAFLPGILEKGAGHIVNISSLLGTMGVAGCTDYCASKFAVVGMHDALKAELERYHPKSRVHFTLVLPSHIRTTLFAGLKPFTTLNSFLLPMLEPHDIATRVVNQIERQQTGELCLPALVNITWIWRGLPSYGRDLLRWISDADDSMSQFHRKD